MLFTHLAIHVDWGVDTSNLEAELVDNLIALDRFAVRNDQTT
jgi:hypothetical protein